MAVLASMKPRTNGIRTATATQNSTRTHGSAAARSPAAHADGCMTTHARAVPTLDYGNVRSCRCAGGGRRHERRRMRRGRRCLPSSSSGGGLAVTAMCRRRLTLSKGDPRPGRVGAMGGKRSTTATQAGGLHPDAIALQTNLMIRRFQWCLRTACCGRPNRRRVRTSIGVQASPVRPLVGVGSRSYTTCLVPLPTFMACCTGCSAPSRFWAVITTMPVPQASAHPGRS
jgi:hypothetical protein